MSVLGYDALIKAMNRKDIKRRLTITPLFDIERQVGPGSIDVRLGYEFITTRRGNLDSIDPARVPNNLKERYEHHHHIDRGEQFVLHPNELVLAATMEWFRLPVDISGYVTSRSSWGRSGLIVATAVAVHPGFVGDITLELVNVGTVPIVLYPGLRVAQFIAFTSAGAREYDGQLARKSGPNSAHGKGDDDLKFWTQKGRKPS